MIIDAETVARFIGHLTARDARQATAVALRLADDGVPLTRILDDLIVPAQVQIGDGWQCGERSVADEHAATAIVDAVVSVLAAETPVGKGWPRIVVVCAEGEWHALPARLVAEALRVDGCAVTFLGASLPVDHLGRFVASTEPDLVAISCTTPLSLRGVLACTRVVHDAGVPVLAGGRGFGVHDRRARTLGADWWAPSATAAAQLVRRPPPERLAVPCADVAGADAVAARRPGAVAGALARLNPEPATRARVEEDLDAIVRFAEAAVLARDRSLFTDFIAWLDAVLRARGLPPDALPCALEALGDVVPA